ncbi:NAD(P)/FAD-dependent oxidoreductase [Devosia sp. ZB163]|uniref:NAD(P)/FAD-dependent oxidoreductase n=1 Tax=Devosia sp. ZB163 TaxID=3025938 RepID=UPI0023621922|nr:NAD(P)/FAD-dependent oxidoreductase [Devosia sp. ZB163]MDC9823876.1 NAD(P)/FAD-dependent oxidoreductase [Devosia sp. ZB163]
MTSSAHRHRVVIIGGGFGGLAAVEKLKGADFDITIIDRRNHHLFQPLLYQVATTSLSPSEIAWPIRLLLKNRPEVTTLLANVTGIDTEDRVVELEDGDRVPYDSLIIATGARHAYFGHDAWEPFAPGLKTLEDATAMRRRLLLAFEEAERETDPERRKALLTFAIIGAGPTGVELAGAVIELARITLKDEFRTIRPEEARVVLIEAGPRVLANFRPDLSDYAKSALEKLGVEVLLNHPVTDVTRDTVRFDGHTLRAETIIWAAGVLASPAAKWLGVEADRAGRIKVEPDLTVPGHPEIFAVGDTVTVAAPDGKPVPGVGDAAKQGGKHAAGVIRARLKGETTEPFRYRHAGDIATIGRSAAVIDFGWLQLTGWVGWWAWGLAHIYFLIGLKNRISVAMSWLWIYLTGHRSARLITWGEAGSGKK